MGLLLALATFAPSSAATLLWTGNGDGSSWNQAANWQPKQVPTEADLVKIPDSTVVTITSTASTAGFDLNPTARFGVTVKSGRLSIYSTMILGMDLEIREGAHVEAPKLTTIERSSVNLQGSGSFEAPVLENINVTSITVRNGARYALPATAQSVSGTPDGCASSGAFLAEGPNSVLELPNVISIKGGDCVPLVIRATDGGRISALAIEALATGKIWIESTGTNSQVELPKLATVVRDTTVITKSAGTIKIPALVNFWKSRLQIYDSGQIEIPSLANIDFSSVEVHDGAKFELPHTVKSYSAFIQPLDCSGLGFMADGPDSVLDLKSLTSIKGSDCGRTTGSTFGIVTTRGGTIHLPNITEIKQGSMHISANGIGSHIDIPLLKTVARDAGISVSDHASVSLPSLSSLTKSHVKITGTGSVTLSSLTNIDFSLFEVFDGAKFVLPASVQSYSGYSQSLDCNGIGFRAEGSGSILDLSSLSTMQGSTCGSARDTVMGISAINGGLINLPNITEITLGSAGFSASGFGSRIDMPKAITLTGEQRLGAWDRGLVNVPALTTLRKGQIEIHGTGVLTAPSLTDIDLTSIMVYDAATFTVPSTVTTYSAFMEYDCNGRQILATGPGSRLEFPALKTLNGSWCADTFSILAEAGGEISMPQLENCRKGSVNLSATGMGSQIQLDHLSFITDSSSKSTLSAKSNGEIKLGGAILAQGYAFENIQVPIGSETPITIAASKAFTIIGKKGSSYKTYQELNGELIPVSRIPMTDSIIQIQLKTQQSEKISRVSEFFANPPELEIVKNGATQVTLHYYGLPGSENKIESSQNLIDFTPFINFTLKDSFNILPINMEEKNSNLFRAYTQ